MTHDNECRNPDTCGVCHICQKQLVNCLCAADTGYLAEMGAACMISAFLQWAVYECPTCECLDDRGDCTHYGLGYNCQCHAFYDNFLRHKS